jgi:hypothetical protein
MRTTTQRPSAFLIAIGVLVTVFCEAPAHADPCGMVPPLWEGRGPAITRVGEQITYAFFKDGVETFVIRPSFSGNVDNFGMLIPFPSAPAIRKVPDDLFAHIAAAIDPPEVVIDLRPRALYSQKAFSARFGAVAEHAAPLSRDEVRVISQEAVGMYEVTVLETGSAKALKAWMDRHGYRYPKGMDAPVADYIRDGWPFVAVKTRVSRKSATTPQAGMRNVKPGLPQGSSFAGNVQAMGFRFRSTKPVIPMRLSAFNAGKLRNIVYFLSEKPVRIDGIPQSLVVRQVSGKELYRNVTDLLPVRILGGTIDDVPESRFQAIETERNPDPHNGKARDLFASDLLAAQSGTLAHSFEEKEKVLLRIGEALFLRGAEVDALHEEALKTERQQTLGRALGAIKNLRLSVFDGDFPREYLRDHNLVFRDYTMPKDRNNSVTYNTRTRFAGRRQNGIVVWGRKDQPMEPVFKKRPWWKFW